MNPEQKQLLRDALLAGLVTQLPLSLNAATLKQVAKAAGFRLEDDALAFEIEYLAGKGFAEKVERELSKGAIRWKATSEAVDYCEREGLV